MKGCPSLIQSNLGSKGNNFEVIAASTTGTIEHYYRDNGDPNLPWISTGEFVQGVANPSLIQSNLGSKGNNLELVVPQSNGKIAHYTLMA